MNRNLRSLPAGLLILCASFSLTAQNAAKPKLFRAGAATSNITPPLGGGIVGNWISPPATQVHDELHARCLVLDDGATRIAIVLVDSVGVTRPVFDHAKSRLAKEARLPASHVLMAATHSHSSVRARGQDRSEYNSVLDDYQRFLASRIVDGVKRAINNLEPARVGWGVGHEPAHVSNRRWFMKEGFDISNPFGGKDQVRMNPPRNKMLHKPAGPIDPQVPVLSVQSKAGRPIAILENYSLHYVGGVPKGHLSADYFGMFADRIQQLVGADRQDPPFVGIMSNGTSADINNIDFTGKRPRRKAYEQMRIVANDLAAEAFKVYQKIKHRDWVPLKAAAKELELKVRRPTPELIERAHRILASPKAANPNTTDKEVVYAKRVLKLEKFEPTTEVFIQTFRVGELGIAAMPFEVFAEIGLDIKEQSPFQPSFTIELANGTFGYLPTPAQHKLGGYETWLGTCWVEYQASEKITKTVVNLFRSLK